ncbi:RibD family protein [Kamptonema cortianum]|nr:RibD family protein [Geitlerinema splendidum]MDK3162435.1 RibD family protein [Kamptonema cortianum]
MDGVYTELTFPEGSPTRPYIVLNMVATIDGKIVTGDRTEPVQDLGSDVDHATMRQIQRSVDAVLIGAGNLRSTPKMWYPPELFRFVASLSGSVPPFHRFFSDAPEKAFVITPVCNTDRFTEEVQVIAVGDSEIDWDALLRTMKHDMNIHRLLLEGGSELNATLLTLDVVDEIFLTIAPKIKLGNAAPTLAGGAPLAREDLLHFSLISALPVGNEVFLRYKRK